MARARNIKPGFFVNDILGVTPPMTRLIFIGIWTIADREGRLEYRPRKIKATVAPYDDVDIEDAIASLIENGFLINYVSNNLNLLQVVNWAKHQNPHHKEIASTLPAPPGYSNGVCDGYIPLSNSIRKRIYERDGRKCKSCGAVHGLSIDHIIPISKGGNSTDDNLQVLCMGCNFSKGNKIQSISHTQVMDESCMTMDESRETLVGPLIPDSLIPDSLIPDSLIPDSLIPEVKITTLDEKTIKGCGENAEAFSPPPANACPIQKIVALYHEKLPTLPQCRKLTSAREAAIRQRWREDIQNLDDWEDYFVFIGRSPFLMGKSTPTNGHTKPFIASLDWLVKAENYAKIYEGKFHNG